MILAKCPLRVSLVGGSTDLKAFIEKYDHGAVISFPATLYTYIMLDYSFTKEYIIHYSKFEKTKNVESIKNDIAREVVKYFDLPPISMNFNADIPTVGTGLAASTSYLLAAIKAVSILKNLNLSQFEICKIGFEIEQKFNSMCGYQDAYGCGLPSLKRLDFYKDKVTVTYLEDKAFPDGTFELINTEQCRQSTDILSTVDISKSVLLMGQVNDLENNIHDKFKAAKIITEGWKIKKLSSPYIMTPELEKLEAGIKDTSRVMGYKLLGAGGGGYFLLMNTIKTKNGFNINIDNHGVVGWKLNETISHF